VAEALAGLEHVDDLVGVHELHGARADDVQPLGGRAVLHECRLPRAEPDLGHGSRQLVQLPVVQPVKRRMTAQEGGDVDALAQGGLSTTRNTGTGARRRTR
jgi:hypothetical protein